MGNLIPFAPGPKALIRRIQREAAKEIRELYQMTRGFQDPSPPSPEEREMFEDGFIELPWRWEP